MGGAVLVRSLVGLIAGFALGWGTTLIQTSEDRSPTPARIVAAVSESSDGRLSQAIDRDEMPLPPRWDPGSENRREYWKKLARQAPLGLLEQTIEKRSVALEERMQSIFPRPIFEDWEKWVKSAFDEFSSRSDLTSDWTGTTELPIEGKPTAVRLILSFQNCSGGCVPFSEENLDFRSAGWNLKLLFTELERIEGVGGNFGQLTRAQGTWFASITWFESPEIGENLQAISVELPMRNRSFEGEVFFLPEGGARWKKAERSVDWVPISVKAAEAMEEPIRAEALRKWRQENRDSEGVGQ